MRTNVPNMANPEISAARFVNATSRRTNIRMSISGSGTRSSAQTHAAKAATAPANRPRIRVDAQPQLSPSVIASKRQMSPVESSTAPTKSTREGVLIGDSEHRRDQPDRHADLFGRELVADDREGEREDRGTKSLHRAESDQRPDVPGRRRTEAADEKDRERDQEQPLLAELVAQLAHDRRRHRRNQQQDG